MEEEASYCSNNYMSVRYGPMSERNNKKKRWGGGGGGGGGAGGRGRKFYFQISVITRNVYFSLI